MAFKKKDGKGTKRSLLETQPTLIGEICDYLAQGATDLCVCRILGISPNTFQRWKINGQEAKGDIYDEFYKRYQKAQGHRELDWLDGIDGKWLLTHHPSTKNDYAEVRYQKQEFSLSPIEEEARNRQMQSAIEEGLGTIKLQIDTQEMIIGEHETYVDDVIADDAMPTDIETPTLVEPVDPEAPKRKNDVLF